MPYAVAFAAGLVDEARCRLWPRAQPRVPLEGVRMGRLRMMVRIDKAKEELGYRPTSVEERRDEPSARIATTATPKDHG